MMLRGIDPILTPELLHTLASMGHGDKLALVDRNYPSTASSNVVHHLSGVDTTEAAHAILALFPVDDFDLPSVFRMVPEEGPEDALASHLALEQVIADVEGRRFELKALHRHDFYSAAQSVRAVVQTTDSRPYSCFILVKGVV